ncbi:CRYB [Mytilus edulis]|uniref:CRYB n=1 Tax=Mytilus edulis TaxID=6550 RepID=A0A8S3RYD8_MYTED|nr:CRYB [Mytilus edulis]
MIKSFVEGCSNESETHVFYSPMSRSPLNTFDDTTKTSKLKCKSGDFVKAQINPVKLVRRALVLANIRENVTVVRILAYPIDPIPSALFHDDGTMWKCCKSDIIHLLEEERRRSEAIKMEPKVTLYIDIAYTGRFKVFTKSCPDLLEAGFDNVTSSVKCEKGDFTGEPECTVFQHYFTGRSLYFRDDIQDLKWYKYEKEISSIEVKSGAWVGYTQRDYDGTQSLFLKGRYKFSDKPYDQGGFKNDSIRSFCQVMVKPTGKMKLLHLDYDLDKYQILKTPSSVFRRTQINNTSVEQSLSKTDEVIIQRVDTYEFRWDKAAKVAAKITANVGIPLGGSTEFSLSAEMSVSMGSTAGTKTSKTEKWIAEYPSKIPRILCMFNMIYFVMPTYFYMLLRVTATSKLTQGNFNMPFTAILYYGDDTEHTITEKGVFYGCQYFDFHTEFNKTKLPKPT